MTEKILGVIPIRGSDPEFAHGNVPMLGKRSLLDYTFDAVKEAKRLDRVIVSTDSEFIATTSDGSAPTVAASDSRTNS